MPRLRSLLEFTGVVLLAACSFAAMQAPAQQLQQTNLKQTSLQPLDTQLDESTKPKAETLSYIVQAGQVLIFNLPELLGGKKIDKYQIKRAPALSWLVTRSFFWRTLATDVGEHEVLLNAMVNGSAVESLVVQVEIR